MGWDWISMASCALGAVVASGICRWRYRKVLEQIERSRDHWRNVAKAAHEERAAHAQRCWLYRGTALLVLMALATGCGPIRWRCEASDTGRRQCGIVVAP